MSSYWRTLLPDDRRYQMGITNFEVPKEIENRTYEAVSTANASGKIRIGVNESTKAIERGIAKLIVIATDVSPEEVVMHLPVLCDEKEVPCSFVGSKEELGRSAGIQVPTSSIAIVESGEADKIITELAKKIAEIRGIKKNDA